MKWSIHALNIAKNKEYSTILDYGCGKGRLAERFAEAGISIAEYDPAIEGKDAPPAPAEFVTCCDVLEHIEPAHINAVLRHLRELAQKRLFVTINTGPARKVLADGRNAHILQRPSAWWRDRLSLYFQILLWEERGAVIAAELIAKPKIGHMKTGGRRTPTAEMVSFFETVKRELNAASDDFSQISDYRMYEGIGDELADLQATVNLLEDVDDIDAALADMARLSKKASFVSVREDDLRSEWDWRRVIERRFRIGRCDRDGDRLFFLMAPAVNVQGVMAVGAVSSSDRWEIVEASIKRFPKQRIPLREAHGRRALLVCYGPSLAKTIETIRREGAGSDTDIISVSGAHDFLIEHGIWPNFHIECDPRPHKALNIKQGCSATSYLIASCVHPDFFDRIEGCDVSLWHISSGEHLEKLLAMGENSKHCISGGGSVGLRAIPLLYGLGYRAFDIFAMDCSYSDSGEKWAGKHSGKKEDAVECKCGDRIFLTSPVLLTYATGFFETLQKVPDISVRLYGDGLLQAMVRYYQELGQPPELIGQAVEENA